MSSFDETIDSDSYQCGNGSAADGVATELPGVAVDKVAYKGITIYNLGAVDLLVQRKDMVMASANALHIPVGGEITLPIRVPSDLRVAGDGAACLMSWFAI